MFTPIKNFITYIQKNASGSTFFGGTSSSAEMNNTVAMEGEVVASNSVAENSHLAELASAVEKNHDQNENELLQDCSATSSIGDDPLMIKEGEEQKDVFLEFPSVEEADDSDLADFTVGEVIVLDDPELNTSVISDPGTDPLAIDECNGHSVANSPNPLDSSADGEVLYIDIDEIGRKSAQNVGEIEVEATNLLTAVKVVDEQEIRSDGSDSGLGSETSALQSTVTSVIDSSACSTASSSPVIEKIPLRSNLKRRLEDVVDNHHQPKRLRKSINFEGVKVFYFPRIQGHGCVPSQGGCTLGMGAHHISFKTFSLAEHAAELRRAHKLQLQEINPRGSSSEESDSDEELSEGSGSDLDAESNGFLQPVSPKQRRAILKAAGVRKIDPSEKIECRDIRNSREVCGCVCRDFCDPDTCACSQAGIKCQVDRAMFPCGCSRDACGNAIGRIEFNPARVRTHFIHTIMRLEMENRQAKRPDEINIQLSTPGSHMVYNNVPAIASSSTSMTAYNPMPSYGLEQSSTAMNHNYHHHHMHQPHTAYLNHMPPGHAEQSVYTNLSNSLVIDAPAAALPQPHNPYVNGSATEPDSISSSLSLNGGNLHYQDGSIYPAVQTTSLQSPTPPAYCDILAPYASSSSYHNAQAADGAYSANVYNNFQSSHHTLHSHLQHQQPQPPFLGYATACSGEMNDYTETQSSFISLNTPDASSSRLSAINDLLHNNRNTTAALVAVSPVSTESTVLDRVEAAVTYVPEEDFSSKDVVADISVAQGDDKECEEKMEPVEDSKQDEKEAQSVEERNDEEKRIESVEENKKDVEKTESAEHRLGNETKDEGLPAEEESKELVEVPAAAEEKGLPPEPAHDTAAVLEELTEPQQLEPKETAPEEPVSSSEGAESKIEPAPITEESVCQEKSELIGSAEEETPAQAPQSTNGSEEERITDKLSPIVETVSA